jgi:hypothetical protein
MVHAIRFVEQGISIKCDLQISPHSAELMTLWAQSLSSDIRTLLSPYTLEVTALAVRALRTVTLEREVKRDYLAGVCGVTDLLAVSDAIYAMRQRMMHLSSTIREEIRSQLVDRTSRIAAMIFSARRSEGTVQLTGAVSLITGVDIQALEFVFRVKALAISRAEDGAICNTELADSVRVLEVPSLRDTPILLQGRQQVTELIRAFRQSHPECPDGFRFGTEITDREKDLSTAIVSVVRGKTPVDYLNYFQLAFSLERSLELLQRIAEG